MRRRKGVWTVHLLIAAIWMHAAALTALAGSLPPRYRFQTIQSGRVRVHFHLEVEQAARRTMALAIEILPGLEERYRVRVPTLDIVVQDAIDAPNGLATSFPYPYVEIRTAGFDGADSGPVESWLRLVVTHELTHIVHIEQARGIYGVGRRVFGRAPFLFPNALQPTWFIEGLAVREETRRTIFGRGRHTYTKMVVDEAARSGQLLKVDQATLGLDQWPFGNGAYLFGEAFLEWLEEQRGPDVTRDLAQRHATSLHPYLDEATFRRVMGKGLTPLWREFAKERRGELEASFVPRLLTTRGTVQSNPRLSPDGHHLAYTSRTLNRLGEIRLMSKDGSSDRRLTTRLSGTALSWSGDGRSIVFDETNLVRKFESRSDLYRVDVPGGRRTRLTTGLRASDPDIGPAPVDAPAPIVFVQRFADRSELSLLVGTTVRTLTTSSAETEWSHPRFSPSGDAIVAARMSSGFLDIVLVNPQNGSVENLTRDRAADSEPAWSDENAVIFRSDREHNVFQLFVVDRDGSEIRRVEQSPQNAFAPEVDTASRSVFYAHYSAAGYDIAVAPFAATESATPYVDSYASSATEPAPFPGAARDYSASSSLAPRFVMPFTELVAEEWRVGLATASYDPLFRVTYGVGASLGTQTTKANALAYLRYDRFTPTFTFLARTESQPVDGGGDLRTTEGRLSVDFPLERSVLRSQTLDLTLRRRREVHAPISLDTGTLAAVWLLDSTRQYPMSISPVDGVKLRAAVTRELKALGSDLDFGKIIVDARGYQRLGPTVVAARVGGGFTYGPKVPRNAYYVGGLPSPALLDPVGDEPAVLRGYKASDIRDASRYGTRIVFGNVDWRVPLAHPQRGVRAYPFFLRHLHLTASLDAAVVAATKFDFSSTRVGASLGLGADVFVGHRLPITIQGGVGRGLTRDGATVPWLSIGFPF